MHLTKMTSLTAAVLIGWYALFSGSVSAVISEVEPAPPELVSPASALVTDDATPVLVLRAAIGTRIEVRSGDLVVGDAPGQGESDVDVAIAEPLPIGIHHLQAVAVSLTGEQPVTSLPTELPPLVVVSSLPLDIGDIVAMLHHSPAAEPSDAMLLLDLIEPTLELQEIPGEPETISQILGVTENTVTGSTYSVYTLPTVVAATTSLGRSIEVPVTWTNAENEPVTEASTAAAGTFVFAGHTADYSQPFTFTLTVTAPDMYRVILTWDQHPQDLDSHLFGQPKGGAPFHLYYGSRTHYVNDVLIAALELDITSGYGPETTTIYFNGDQGTYQFVVHQYSQSGVLFNSSAKVDLYRGDTLLATYHVGDAEPVQGTSTESARYWNVFELVDGSLVPIETLEASMPSNSPPA